MAKPILHLTSDNYNKDAGMALIDANNDSEAIESFLNEYKASPETLRSYTKEIERLLLWCLHVANVNIASLRRDHLIAYFDFLKHPTPKKIWCGSNALRLTKTGELNPNWRPFVKGLQASSIQKAVKILDSFFNYLVLTHYLVGNPLAVDRRRKRRHQAKQHIVDRYLELDEIHAVLDTLIHNDGDYNDNDNFQIIRARYIILLLFYTGLRISEAANYRMGHCIEREEHWFLRINW